MTESAPLALLDATPAAPVPMYSGEQMATAFRAYQQLQQALDKSMPDQIMTIEGRAFRKKGYWRAIAVAFNLTVEPVEERRLVQGAFGDGEENFGYALTYKATAPNGRSACGDGTCFAIEKASRRRDVDRWAVAPYQATEHNVRSHAHTRAFNRAVSNLVGFGEVSAEEMERENGPRVQPSAPVRMPQNGGVKTPDPTPRDQATITEMQRRKLFAVTRRAGWKDEDVKNWLREVYDLDSTTKIPKAKFDEILAKFTEPVGGEERE